MNPKKKKTKDLIKRRLAQKLCKKRRYAEIKNDPELLELEKQKRRDRYLKQKEANANKDKSSRAVKKQRKMWRDNSKRYRQKKKEELLHKPEPPFPVINVEASNDNENNRTYAGPEFELNDPLHTDITAKVNKIRYKELLKRKKLLRIIKTYKKKNESQHRLIKRLKKRLSGIQMQKSSEISETEENSSEENTKNPLIEQVIEFYNDDSNSVIGAGKREYITRDKVQKQKRYLCLPLKDLYKKFISETNMRISYSFFCKLRPFWVLFPKNTNRETCQCTTHVNMELLISALNKASVLKEINCDQVLSKLCCDPRNTNCLQRTCDACRSNHLDYNTELENKNMVYFQWVKNTKDTILKSGIKKKQIITGKISIRSTVIEAKAKLEKDLIIFFQHVFKFVGQYKTIKTLKDNLNIHEALIHVDFSENYSLKYAEEVQPFHFGGSRHQVSLHIAVIYTHNFDTGLVSPKSMCTISDCLRHDAAAVWAHLIPLIEEAKKLNTLIDTIHFLSDSPSSQYRNKTMFYIVSQISKDFPDLNIVTRNYSEAGHGKGAPDGIGATLKRTADKMVLYGEDVGSFDDFYNTIKSRIDNVIIKKNNENDIKAKSDLIPSDLKPFKGTLSVHQLLWDKSQKNITLRKMSCFDCSASQTCVHGFHLGQIEVLQQILRKIHVLTDITIKKANIFKINTPSTSKEQ